jgi:hypothetical protein
LQIRTRENLLNDILSKKIYQDVDVTTLASLVAVTKGGIAAYRDALRKVQDAV